MTMRQTSSKFQRSLSGFGRKAEDVGGGADYADGIGSPGGIKKLSAKLAHTTLIPALGNSETRLLQDLITAEKGVLQAHERLASETDRAAATLSTWAASEGPDLSDVFSSSSVLLRHLSSAMQRFGEHEALIRGHYKTIRTKDEEFEELRKRRRAVGRNAEAAERKLQKMGPENKNLPSQTELLERLREEMRVLDSEILTDEARLGDEKRRLSKQAMAIKFGGLLELAEKMTIVGELGKLIIEEIPLEETPPGFGRAPYGGFEQCSRLVDEASRCISEVAFVSPEIHILPSGAHSTEHRVPTTSHTAAYGDLPASGSLYNERRGPVRQDSGNHTGVAAVMFDAPTTPRAEEPEHDYEYEQQREMDAAREREEAVWREDAEATAMKAGFAAAPVADLGLPIASHETPSRRYADENEGHHQGNASPRYSTIMDLPSGAGPCANGPGEDSLARYQTARDAGRFPSPPLSPNANQDSGSREISQTYTRRSVSPPLPALNPSYDNGSWDNTDASDIERFSTPISTPPLTFSNKAPTPGKISAGAFRRAAQPAAGVEGARRLPVPPGSVDAGSFPEANSPTALPAYEGRGQ